MLNPLNIGKSLKKKKKRVENNIKYNLIRIYLDLFIQKKQWILISLKRKH